MSDTKVARMECPKVMKRLKNTDYSNTYHEYMSVKE